MHILHINQAFPYQTAHPGLVRAISHETGWEQTVYAPIRSTSARVRFDVTDEPYEVLLSLDYNNVDRLMQGHKHKKIAASMNRQLDASRFDLVHAHTLVAMGLVASRWARTHGTPFVVSVRNTDLTTFLSRPKLYGKMAARVAEEAKALICINPSFADQLQETMSGITKTDFGSKLHVLPNGIDDYWLSRSTTVTELKDRQKPIEVLYVGEFTTNKNIHRLIEALELVETSGTLVRLTLVGDGPKRSAVEKRAAASTVETEVLDWTTDRDALAALYQRSDLFAMPSLTETFGLVYVEALSQGLPILYTKGQGIDGYFPDGHIGVAVDPRDVSDIQRGLLIIVHSRKLMAAQCHAAARRFAWPKIGSKLAKIYRCAIG